MLARLAAPLLGGMVALFAGEIASAAHMPCHSMAEAWLCLSETGEEEMWIASGERAYSDRGRVLERQGGRMNSDGGAVAAIDFFRGDGVVVRFSDGFELARRKNIVADIRRDRFCRISGLDLLRSERGADCFDGRWPRGLPGDVVHDIASERWEIASWLRHYVSRPPLRRCVVGDGGMLCRWFDARLADEMWVRVGGLLYSGGGQVWRSPTGPRSGSVSLRERAYLKSGGVRLGFSNGVVLIAGRNEIYAPQDRRRCQVEDHQPPVWALFACSEGRPPPGKGEASDRIGWLASVGRGGALGQTRLLSAILRAFAIDRASRGQPTGADVPQADCAINAEALACYYSAAAGTPAMAGLFARGRLYASNGLVLEIAGDKVRAATVQLQSAAPIVGPDGELSAVQLIFDDGFDLRIYRDQILDIAARRRCGRTSVSSGGGDHGTMLCDRVTEPWRATFLRRPWQPNCNRGGAGGLLPRWPAQGPAAGARRRRSLRPLGRRRVDEVLAGPASPSPLHLRRGSDAVPVV